jgi:hypothetical protein
MNKIYILIVFIFAIVLFSNVYLFNEHTEMRDIANRREDVIINLNQSVKKYQLKDSSQVVQLNKLNLTLDEFKLINTQQLKLIKDLSIRLKDVESTGSIIINSKDTLYVPVTTLSNNDRTFEYEAKWISIQGVVSEDEACITYNKRDSITVIESIERKRFLFIRYGVKNRKVTVVSADPKSVINVGDWVRIVEK